MALKYTSDTIEVKSNLQHIRARPTGYIPSRGVSGQVHMIREPIDNSVDELVLNPDGGTITIGIFRNTTKWVYQIVVQDNGRGIPSASLRDVITVIGASGKISDKTAYTSSGGLFGIGGKVAPALSKQYRVISANYLENITADLILKDAEVVQHVNHQMQSPHGVTIVMEPDVEHFFDDSMEFMVSGYLDIAKICRQLNIFNPLINFRILLFDRLLPQRFWQADAFDAQEIIADFFTRRPKEIVYDSSQVPDKAAYLFDLWRVNSAVLFQDVITKRAVDATDRLSYEIKLFLTKKSATGSAQFFVSINNIALVDKTENSATKSFMGAFKHILVKYITDAKYAEFVMQDYRFPTLMLAIGVRYHGAELAGTTKTSFQDTLFAKQFYAELIQCFMDTRDTEYWQRLVETLMPDIEQRYAQFYDAPIKKSDAKKTFLELNFDKNFEECVSGDAAQCELYLVEGTSAGNIIDTRNKQYQAVYMTRGKPTNGASYYEQISQNRAKLLKDPIYQDIMRIMNVNPNTRDISSARFHKLIITTDADSEGYHIRSLHINNLYIINPLFITGGLLWLADPPLYSMELGRNKRLFLRDKTALMDARIKFVYNPVLKIRVETKAGIIEAKPDLYRDICYLVNHVGEHFQVVADQLNIPLLMLERLVFAVDYLYPKIQYDKLADCFKSGDPSGYVRVQVNQPGRFIVLTVGKEDYPIGLDHIGDTIVKQLLPLVKKYRLKDYMYLVSSKHKGSALYRCERPLSAMMLYQAMCQLNGLFSIRRYKGLGQMLTPDCAETIMNPETRSLTHVTDIGDYQLNYALLGKDTTERKTLLSETNVLGAMFR